DRQAALWQIRALKDEPMPLFESAEIEDSAAADSRPDRVALPRLAPEATVARDYAALGLSLKNHPIAFLRPQLAARGVVTAADLQDESRCPNGRTVTVAGLVMVRQRPGTAKGILFMTLEDETGNANLIVRPHIYERYRQAARYCMAVLAKGKVERRGEVVHLLPWRLEGLNVPTGPLPAMSRDFH